MTQTAAATREAPPSPPFRRWTRRLTGASIAQAALIVALVLLLWLAAYGGRLAMVVVAGNSMQPTYESGDLVITWRGDAEIGDIILHRTPDAGHGRRLNVIHRVVGGEPSGWITRGDNNPEVDPWNPARGDILGVARATIPGAGRLLTVMGSRIFLATIAGLATLLLCWPEPGGAPGHRGRDDSPQQ